MDYQEDNEMDTEDYKYMETLKTLLKYTNICSNMCGTIKTFSD
jgi:hypothetical protein